MKSSIIKRVLIVSIAVVAGGMLYHYGGRYWARQQVDRFVFKDEQMREFVAARPEFRDRMIDTAFIETACGKDDGMAATILRAGYPATTRNEEGLTPLHCAAATGNLDLVKDLVSAGAEVQAHTKEFDLEPIHYAAWYRRWNVIGYLLAKGVSINEPSKLGPPVALAANEGQVWRMDRLRPEARGVKRPDIALAAIVDELASRGAALDGAGPDGTTLMHWAARRQDVSLMNLLATKGGLSANVRNELGQTPLLFAFDQSPWQPLDKAHSHLDTVKWLVSHGADVNARDENGASIALQAVRHPDFLEMLMPALDLNVADDKGNSIWTSLGFGAVAFARTQPTIGTPMTTDGRPGRGPLHVFAKEAQADGIEYFLGRGVNPNQPDQDGVTPLHEVLRSSGGVGDVRRNRPLIVEMLLAAGADPNARTNQGLTPLMLAVGQPPEAIKSLIAAHADVNAMAMENGRMTSILDHYMRRGKTEGAEILIKAGARTEAERWLQPQSVTAVAGSRK